MHRCQRLVHPSKQLCDWFCGMAFRAAVGITPDVTNVIKMPSFQYFLYPRELKKSHWGLDPVNREGVPTQLFV